MKFQLIGYGDGFWNNITFEAEEAPSVKRVKLKDGTLQIRAVIQGVTISSNNSFDGKSVELHIFESEWDAFADGVSVAFDIDQFMRCESED